MKATSMQTSAQNFNATDAIIIFLKVILLLYCFLVGVSVLGGSFKFLGADFANSLLQVTSNPFIGLISGMVATTLFQSSSVTTSIVVGFVAGGALSLNGAIPMIMGANLGTSVTNTLVSLGFAKNKAQFSKAIAAATVHDFFNILTTLVIFPLEISFGFLEKASVYLSGALFGGSSLTYSSPIKAAIKPVSKSIITFFSEFFSSGIAGILLIATSAIIITMTLYFIVKTTKKVVQSNKAEVIEKLLSKNAYSSVFFGIIITIAVQSSSITTSLLVPLAGSGLLSLRSILPVTVGANIGTTATALLAALAGNLSGLAIAIVHFLFNICGTLIWFVHPNMREVPIKLAQRLGELSQRKRAYGIGYVATVFFVLPLVFMVIFR